MKSPTCLYTNAVNFSLVSVVQVMDDVIELGRWYVHGMHLVFSKSENASVVFLLIPLSKFRPRNPDSGNCSFYRQDADVLSNSFLSHIFGRHNCLSEG